MTNNEKRKNKKVVAVLQETGKPLLGRQFGKDRLSIRITRHAANRAKERVRIKNSKKIERRAILAVERGLPRPDKVKRVGTRCFEFGGYIYVVTNDLLKLITLFPSKSRCSNKKSWLVEQRVREEDRAEMVLYRACA